MLQEKQLPPLFNYDDWPEPLYNGNGLSGQDIISVDQFDTDKLDYIFARAHQMRELVERRGSADLLKGNILTCLFYEPSTRTSASFIAATAPLTGA